MSQPGGEGRQGESLAALFPFPPFARPEFLTMKMILSGATEFDLVEAMAADIPTLAPAAANKVALVKSNFTPSKTLTLADVTLAAFTGSTPKAGAAGGQQAGIDPTTNRPVITNLAPAGGWRYECTVAPADPGEVIYGAVLLDTALAVVLASGKLPVPKTISAVGHYVDLGDIELLFASPIATVD